MWNTSNKYKELIYTGKECLLNIYIEDTLIDDNDIVGFRVGHNLFSSDVSLGGVFSRNATIEIKASALPQKYENFYIETGLNIDGEDEIVPIGFFMLEEIEKDEDIVTITAVDYMMNFERIIDISSFLGNTAIKILQYLCFVCGVELGSTSFLNMDEVIETFDTSLTVRQIIGYIAELAGGFAFIGRDGKLYIKKIGENSSEIDIELFSDYKWGEKFLCNEVKYKSDSVTFEISDTNYSSAYLDCTLDSALYDNEVEGRALELNSGNIFINSESQIQKIYEQIKGLECYGFNGTTIIDPSLDIGDIIYIDSKPVIYQGDIEYLGYFKGNISVAIETEQKKETTVGSTINYTLRFRKIEESIENKVDIENIIHTINSQNSEEKNETINPEKLNINGIESENGNFGIDADGNMTCKNATIVNGTIKIGENFEVDEYGNIYCNAISLKSEHLDIGKYLFVYDKGTFVNNQLIVGEDGIAITDFLDTDELIITNSTISKKIYTGRISGWQEILKIAFEENLINITGGITTSGKITCQTLEQTSLETEKKNFEKFENALDKIKNIEIYKYNLNSEKDGTKKHIGFVIGDGFNYSKEITNQENNKVDIYSFVSLCCKAIQEQQREIEKLKQKIESLKGE